MKIPRKGDYAYCRSTGAAYADQHLKQENERLWEYTEALETATGVAETKTELEAEKAQLDKKIDAVKRNAQKEIRKAQNEAHKQMCYFMDMAEEVESECEKKLEAKEQQIERLKEKNGLLTAKCAEISQTLEAVQEEHARLFRFHNMNSTNSGIPSSYDWRPGAEENETGQE